MTEIWKDILEWEGLYQVSNLGRVKSFRGNILKTHIHNGALSVKLCENTYSTNYMVKGLVFRAFIGLAKFKQINCINGDLYNCSLINLSPIKSKTDIYYSINKKANKFHDNNLKLKDFKINQIKKWNKYKHLYID